VDVVDAALQVLLVPDGVLEISPLQYAALAVQRAADRDPLFDAAAV
jgi:hypothetical protein